MKRILVTAGAVYAPLDGNKIVSNRAQGVWAVLFADYLADLGHEVVLVVPDLTKGLHSRKNQEVIKHSGFWDYYKICQIVAPRVDAAVMAAAVTNWIPRDPFPGKMPTDREEMSIPFILTPHVIDEMRKLNPQMTLIGCKLGVDFTLEQLETAAYKVIEGARCHAVIMNDRQDLKRKMVLHPDGAILSFDDNFKGLYTYLRSLIEAQHYQTVRRDADFFHEGQVYWEGLFDKIIERNRPLFSKVIGGKPRFFGSLMTRMAQPDHFLASPREKGAEFSSKDAVIVVKVDHEKREVHTCRGKATLNAPLLHRVLQEHPDASAVLHLHQQIPGAYVSHYVMPGTAGDTMRDPLPPTFNIVGHGFVQALNADGYPLR